MRGRPFAIILMLLTVSAAAYGADPTDTATTVFNTGEGLLQRCTTAEQHLDGETMTREQEVEATSCIAYIGGVADTINVYPPKDKGKQLVCFPKGGFRGAQLVRVVVKWMRDHPEALNEPRLVMVLAAFHASWPCK
jgi:hypothetical protein